MSQPPLARLGDSLYEDLDNVSRRDFAVGDLADRQGEQSGEQDDGDLDRVDVWTDPTEPLFGGQVPRELIGRSSQGGDSSSEVVEVAWRCEFGVSRQRELEGQDRLAQC